ncbi:ATPase domain-containing protein [Halosegnis marinus]|uniref:ATPase domain-containing protein n=1 Tax=Halosegnis marinus TaxID=3034023 RepID=A0ABD5ZPP8_9EURY|nr:ATPase domain-containing protein [Halosegnis sp. DT85]
MNHLSIGLESRDRVNHAVGGGFPEGSLVLVEGGTGAGKSVLASRFAYGLAEEGTRVTVVATDATAREYVDQMHSLSYDVVEHLLAERLRYYHAPVDGDRPLLAPLTETGGVWTGDALVADGFGRLCRNDPRFGPVLGSGDEDRAMQRFLGRLDRPLAAGKVAVVTVDPATLTERALRPLRGAADVYLELHSEAVGQEIRKKALVRRFAGMKQPVDDTIGFSVQQGRGIVIESRTIA